MREELKSVNTNKKDKNNLSKAYVELLSFFELIDKKDYDILPKGLLKYLEENKDKNYCKKINPNISIEEQSLLPQTLDLIAFLNLKYWCKDEKEKNELRRIYYKNDKLKK